MIKFITHLLKFHEKITCIELDTMAEMLDNNLTSMIPYNIGQDWKKGGKEKNERNIVIFFLIYRF